MTRDCETCGGDGALQAGHRIGPCESHHIVTCDDCHGKRVVPVMCQLCGDHEATREAWVVVEPKTAKLLLICIDCHDHDETEIVTVTTRSLPKHMEVEGHA